MLFHPYSTILFTKENLILIFFSSSFFLCIFVFFLNKEFITTSTFYMCTVQYTHILQVLLYVYYKNLLFFLVAFVSQINNHICSSLDSSSFRFFFRISVFILRFYFKIFLYFFIISI